MAAIKYKVKLTESERSRLNEVSHRGKPSVRTVKRALALLKADEGLRDGEIAGVLLVNAATIARVRKRFVEEGLEDAINDRPRPGRERKLDGKQEAHLVAIACSSPPEGHVNWTLHLLANKVVEMELAGSISLETVRQILKKTNSSPRSATGQAVEEKGMVHPQAERGVRRRMEDLLDPYPVLGQALYHEEYDRERPVVCFDESSKQLVEDVRPPIKAKPGRVERYDTEYQRNGTRNLFMFCEPKGGWRHVEVTGRRTAVDFAQQMKWLVDEAYPDAKLIRLVLDNLNTHKPGSLYEAFAPSEARRIAKRLELHHTPNHGSWLNMAEIEFSVFSRQCLNRRVGDEALLRREIAALERERNEAAAIIDWRFSTQDARSKLKHVYPIELN